MSLERIAVIGAGRLGREFALACVRAGYRVTLEDVMPEKLRRAQDAYVSLATGPGRLHVALTVEEAVRDADLAIDFVPDELESKLEIFCLLDRMAPPRTVLCTPTTALSIGDLASCTYRPAQCVAVRGADLVTGPVDLIYAPASSAETRSTAGALWRALGCEVTLSEEGGRRSN